MSHLPSTSNSLDFRINSLIENVFKFTINKNRNNATSDKQTLVYLDEVAATTEKPVIDLEVLEHALFERLLLEDPTPHLLKSERDRQVDIRATLNECITYLFECFKDLSQYSRNIQNEPEEWKNIINHVMRLIIRNAATALKQPELYSSQDIHAQFIGVFSSNNISHGEELIKFFKDIAEEMKDEEAGSNTIYSFLQPVLSIIEKDIQEGSILILPVVCLDTLEAFSRIPEFAKTVVKYSMPLNRRVGKNYADRLLGAIFCISSLPKKPDSRDEYFDKITIRSDAMLIFKNLWVGLENLSIRLHRIMLSFLRCPEVRNDLLAWFGECIENNTSRKQLWGNMMQQLLPMEHTHISDGFALNLCSVLIRLCEPFMKSANNPKLLKIDPTYCAVESAADFDSKKVHLKNVHSETCLIPVEENEKRLIAKGEYSFITECFFMTHSALELGVKACLDRLMNLNQEIGRMQELLQTDRFTANENIRGILEDKMQSQLIKYISLKTALIEPSFISYLGDFHRASCTWLVQLLLDNDQSTERETFAPLKYRPLSFPLPDPPNTLKCVPEFVFENLCSYLVLVRRFKPTALEEKGTELLDAVLTALVVYMDSNKLVRNPHLRARLAECLECLLPTAVETDMPEMSYGSSSPLNFFYRTKLFNEHPLRRNIISSLLEVFVGIEMTGQSVQFEQKFNYRRPMYNIMDYLWTLPEQKEVFKELAIDAEQNMEAVNPPLFLRFINILINDAIFLLDEALSNMAQLRQMQTALENNEWDRLPSNEREQNIQQLQHTGMIARFDNILGMNTINTLEYLTEEIKTIFCHSTMVDRVAAMLNYFLHHLVGPKKKTLKVNNKDEYKFEPGTIVRKICSIYVHLGSSDVFCAAVSRDGRSYSPQLFEQAANVLVRIRGLELVQDLNTLSKRVAELASQQMTEEEILAEAPDDYLDPIMSTLMTDPVLLPSSRKTVDRSTIARHLLSDQTDPFNRSPLTMDMVQPNTDLKRKIDEWIQEKRAKTKET